MKRTLRNVLFLGVAVLSLKGCIFTTDPEPPEPPDTGTYAQPTAPESLINNLQVSYRRREIQEYAKILAPEFIFKFQPVDQGTIGKEFWTHDEDSVGTEALLEAPVVQEIVISLLFSGRDTTWNTPGTPVDTLKIRILTTDLQVNQTDDISWVVTDQQDMFFRSGKPENGEDPTRWFLYEWDDIPSLASPGISPLSAAGPETQPLRRSWGTMLAEMLKAKTSP